MKEDSANELEQLEINKLKESSEKVLRQRKLNHNLELQAIEREAEDKKLQEIEKLVQLSKLIHKIKENLQCISICQIRASKETV